MTPETRSGAGKSAASVILVPGNTLKHSNPSQKPQEAIRIAADPVMQQAVQKIHDQGPRMVLELLSTLAESNMLAVAVEREIKRFSQLPPGALRAIGYDQIRRFYPLEVSQ